MVISCTVPARIIPLIIMLPLVFTIGCNRDQSTNSPQASSSSSTRSSAAAVSQSSSTTDTTATNTTTTTSVTTTTTAVTTTTSPQASVKPGPQNYGQVKVGMSSKQVLDLMGSASKVEQEGQTTEWEYYLPQGGKFELRLQNDKVISTRRH